MRDLQKILLFSCMIFFACTPEDDTQFNGGGEAPPSNTNTAIFSVYECTDLDNDPGCLSSVAVYSGVRIALFESQDDFDFGEPIHSQKTTNAEGKAEFSQMTPGTYWYRAAHAEREQELTGTINLNGNVIAHPDLRFSQD